MRHSIANKTVYEQDTGHPHIAAFVVNNFIMLLNEFDQVRAQLRLAGVLSFVLKVDANGRGIVAGVPKFVVVTFMEPMSIGARHGVGSRLNTVARARPRLSVRGILHHLTADAPETVQSVEVSPVDKDAVQSNRLTARVSTKGCRCK